MEKTTLKELEQKQFDAYSDYQFAEVCLEIFKEKNPNYEKELTLWVKFMNLELNLKIKKHLYEVAITKWGIENVKHKFVESK